MNRFENHKSTPYVKYGIVLAKGVIYLPLAAQGTVLIACFVCFWQEMYDTELYEDTILKMEQLRN